MKNGSPKVRKAVSGILKKESSVKNLKVMPKKLKNLIFKYKRISATNLSKLMIMNQFIQILFTIYKSLLKSILLYTVEFSNFSKSFNELLLAKWRNFV